MPGVFVQAKGTTIGAIVGAEGNYEITVPDNIQVLVFSFVGFKTQEVPIEGRTRIDVILESDLYRVDEIVVVGYGTQKKREVTGSITAVKGDELKSFATPSFESQLAGRSAGVQITQYTGILGQTPRLRIRGVGSLSSDSYPLIVVDGIPILTGDLGGYAFTNALADINPADIESMEILKDGSATAIYGSRASNGVILITTKRGNLGVSRMKMNYNNYIGYASPVRLFDLLNASEFEMINNEKRSNRGQSAIAFSDGEAYPGQTFETDWQRALLRMNAFQQDHSLSISGATDASSYYFSLGYSDQDGVTRPNKMKRFTAKSSADQKVTRWLKIGASIGLTQTEYNALNTGSNALSGNILSVTRQHPNVPIYNPSDPTGYNIEANLNIVGRWNNIEPIGDALPNIVYIIDNNVYYSKVQRAIGNFYTQIWFFRKLDFKTQVSIDGSKTDGFLYWNALHGDGASVKGRVQNNFSNNLRWNLQNILTYGDLFGNAHNLSLVLVNEIQFTRNNSFSSIGTNLSDEFFRHNIITGTAGTMSVTGDLAENGFISYAGRLNYNFRNKYFFQGSLRYDGISALPVNNKWGLFPGGSFGWTLTEESFMSGIKKILSDLKIRTSYAQVGNVGIGNYPSLGLYGPARYADNNGIGFSQAGNERLQWETSKKFDIGFDASLYEGKYKFSFDYYLNNQDGLILTVPVPGSLGIPGNYINKNIGVLRNTGIEFSTDAYLIRKDNIAWQIDANLTLAGNEIIKLVNHQDITLDYQIQREGESYASIYGYKYWGVNPANGNPVYYKADGTLVQGNIPNSTYYVFNPADPGNISTPSSLSSSLDKFVLGPSLPTYYGGLNSKFTYKRFDLNVMFRYSGGNYIINGSRIALLNQNFVNNSREILGRWQSTENPGDGWTPRLWFAGSTFVNLEGNASTRSVEKGDFIRLQNLVLGYNLPFRILSRAGIDNLRIFLQGQDLLVLTKYTGIDPEMEQNGIDLYGTPRQRVITMGINLTL